MSNVEKLEKDKPRITEAGTTKYVWVSTNEYNRLMAIELELRQLKGEIDD